MDSPTTEIKGPATEAGRRLMRRMVTGGQIVPIPVNADFAEAHILAIEAEARAAEPHMAYLVRRPCGCFVAAIVQDPEPEHAIDAGRELGFAKARGDRIDYLPVETVRPLLFAKCDVHIAEPQP